ncbi:Subtilisin DY-like protein [Cladobotryum mycophilum]|uniref:Subtilisin DY-like protein n=1 Tax=Cladobotryum mycophilum TaxID=491253 RepID=A0ABR0SGQ8_9HYPO
MSDEKAKKSENGLLRYLGQSKTVAEFHTEFEKSLPKRTKSSTTGPKFHRAVARAIEDQLNELRHQQPNTFSTAAWYEAMVENVKEILNFRENEKMKRASLSPSIRAEWSDGPIDELRLQPAYIIATALCRLDPPMAFVLDERRYSPFEIAAASGLTGLVRVMIDELAKYYQTSDSTGQLLLQHVSRKSKSKLSAFQLAAKKCRLDVLKLLLDEFPSLADKDSLSATMKRTVPNSTNDDDDSGLDMDDDSDDKDEATEDDALEAFKLILDKVKPVDDFEIWQEAVKTPSLKVVKYLIDKAASKDALSTSISYENVKCIIESGTIEMWEALDGSILHDLMSKNSGGLLHIAVQHLKVNIVEHIVTNYPNQIQFGTQTSEKSGNEIEYPIQCLRRPITLTDLAPDSEYMKIRDLLLHAMIRSDSAIMGIKDIRRILSKSNIEANTICLHLSTINTEEQSFADYVQWLDAQKQNTARIFKFEKVLKYANFPDLDSQTTATLTSQGMVNLREDHTEISDVFKWLGARGVQQVLELSVPDRLLCPHSDESVTICVNDFSIQLLNWRKLDLYLGGIKNKDNLRELHLYSSGNPSVHDHWCQELPKFAKLERLYINVVEDCLSKPRVQKVIGELQQRLDDINRSEDVNYRWTKKMPRPIKDQQGKYKVHVKETSWNTRKKRKTYRKIQEITNDIVRPNLSAFIEKFKGESRNLNRKTRIALIDSGVVIVGGKDKSQPLRTSMDARLAEEEQRAESSINDLAQRVRAGTSFVRTGDDHEQVWWHASEPHGTQMARLICSIDPTCELYVAKVAETRSAGIPANIVSDAIHWAIEKDVDIISLSLVAYTDVSNLSNALMAAKDKDIVILCSTADEGYRSPTAVTGQSQHQQDVFTIAAHDQWGNVLDYSQKGGYSFGFIGNNVHVGQVPFLKSTESVSGSSVATAIAAGTASLILACYRLSLTYTKSQTNSANINRWRCRAVHQKFSSMQEKPENKFVALDNLCGKDKRLRDADFKATIQENFAFKWDSNSS